MRNVYLWCIGLYGRVNKNSYFQATVTNVDPSAKQSRVLNPYVRH
jgi:DNA (cytosine-5)-methyltransferase 1